MLLSERRQRYRNILKGSECVHPASVFDAMSARMAESLGFEVGMLSGSIASGAVLGAPDLVVLTLTEFAQQGQRITRASDISLMVDADHGYGNALNVMRTVQEMEQAGVSALTIEDTVLPQAFGSKEGLISIPEMVGKLRAALSARQDPSLVIIGRTNTRVMSNPAELEERVKAYHDTGIDGVFLAGIGTAEQLAAVRPGHQPASPPRQRAAGAGGPGGAGGPWRPHRPPGAPSLLRCHQSRVRHLERPEGGTLSHRPERWPGIGGGP